MNQDGSEKKCIAPFSLLGNHECQLVPTKRKKKKLSNSNFAKQNIKTLNEHKGEVFVCAWNTKFPLLATGYLILTRSGDGTARIWSIPDDPAEETTSIVLTHSTEPQNKDVTTLDWSPDGNLLATGSYDGLARIWHKNGTIFLSGTIKYKMEKHLGPIFSLKWNKTGDLLLSGGVDKSAIVWDIRTGDCRQQFSFHQGPTLDVDWRDDTTFATSSADMKIYVCQLGSLAPLKQFQGHKDEVNCIRWDPSGKYLASCADDQTAKVWTLDNDEPILDLAAHGKEIYTIRWCPPGFVGNGSTTDKQLWLATYS